MRFLFALSLGSFVPLCLVAAPDGQGAGSKPAGSKPGWLEPRFVEAFKFVSGFFGLDAAREKGGQASKMTLIGAGFSRTGTKSLEAALLRLGHKVYDTRSMMELGHVTRWEMAAEQFKAAKNSTAVDQLLTEIEAQGYTATLDFPMNLFAPIFAELRPSAKVLMSARPSEESWVEAWGKVNEILGIFILRPWCWILDMGFNRRILRTMYQFEWEYPTYPEHIWRPVPWFEVIQRLPAFETQAARQAWLDLHQRLQRELEAQLPAERFATFDVRSGWKPLLDFLGIDNAALAAEPFPRVNDQGSLQAVRVTMDVVATGLPLWVLLTIWLFSKCARCLCRGMCKTTKEKRG
mmetsp:Transcript_18188/g.47298  ORF Transcript_18188/g.47298 Transcript_18188/m.47298 type:complete len:349 (+) Transcript_18188:73-1119(+)